MEDNRYISDSAFDEDMGQSIIVCSVPIKNDGHIVGVLFEVIDGDYLSEMTDTVKFGQTGKAFILNSKGVTIAHVNRDLVKNQDCTIENAKTNPELKELAEFNQRMINGETGVGEYSYKTKKYLSGFAPIEGTSWSVAVQLERYEILAETSGLRISMMIASLIFICIGLVIIYFISSGISKRIAVTARYLGLLAEGDLSRDIPEAYLLRKDEFGVMAVSVKTMQDSLKGMIGSIKESASNVNVQSENLSSISEEIASSSQNVSESISNVAIGTSTQSDNINDIVTTLDDFSSKISGMVENAHEVDANSREIGKKAESSNKEMNELNESINNISDSFKEFYNKITYFGQDVNKIDEITALINDISEQTNLLALNASIEAARAGEAGKGFAVVADEIRVLAEQSKNSVENISKLINSISNNTDSIINDSLNIDNELKRQVGTVNSSIKAFREIVDGVDNMIPKIDTLKASAVEIEGNKNGIFNKIDELSSIAVEVSASSEEISASSEEMNAATEEVASSAQVLSSMTNDMMEEVNKFKL